MVRSWQERLLGGVCDGLSQRIGLSAWSWRLIFILLTLLTGGWGALVYLLGWWLLPLDIPGQTTRAIVPTLLLLLSSALILGGFVSRDTLVASTGASLYAPLMAVLVALVFFLCQWGQRARGMIVISAVLLAVTVAALLAALGVLPRGVDDLLVRAAGGLLLFLGLALLLRERVPLGSLVAAVISVAVVGGVAVVAYNTRIGEQRSENVVEVTFDITDNVTLLQLNLTALDTDVVVRAAPPGQREARLNFVGSLASEIVQSYQEDDVIATLTLSETRGEGLPSLTNIGRGKLLLEIPANLGVAVAFVGGNGEVSFDMSQTNLERLDMDLSRGSALVTFPNYQPLSPSVAARPGELIVRDGTLTLVAPPPVGGQFLISKATNQRPLFDDLVYALEDNLNDWLLTARQYDTSPARIRYVLTVPRAQIRLDTTPANP